MTAQFQTFDDLACPTQGTERIPLLRAELRRRGLDGFVVPRADEHQSEYVPPSADRLAWLTGFTGSAGTAVILAEEAAIVVDGRYTLQAAGQVDTALLTVVPQATTSTEAWIEAHLGSGKVLGYDPWLHTRKGVEGLAKAVDLLGSSLHPCETNPLDSIWCDRPASPCAAVTLHPDDLAGECREGKLARLRDALAKVRLDGLVVSDPQNLAWLFNLRGSDVAHTPVALGYGIVPREGQPVILLDPAKLSNEVSAILGEVADLAAPDRIEAELKRLAIGQGRIRLDSATAAAAIRRLVKKTGLDPDMGPDPLTAMKAVKNAAEVAGSRNAHLRDGAAVTRFLHWLDQNGGRGVTEIDAVEALEGFRRQTGVLKDVSFPTISGSGPNGAIVHYRVTRASDRALGFGELFLVDSGAQYLDGTTDITRTVAIGEPSPEMRDRFTRVLKGHIAIARAIFPQGTSGAQLDSFARRPLWDVGLDFEHGTGHGIGSYLSVHEGPQRISKLGTANLEAGMILSNEPGYYKAGAYGIRIENLILVEAREIADSERTMLGFETLTLAPIDRTLVEPALLSRHEAAWLDAYHARVREALTPLVDPATAAWLANATRPLG